MFLDSLGFAIVLPYLFFFAESLGATPFMYGLLITSYSLMQFVFTPILGRLSDSYGRRKILLSAFLISSFSYFVFGIAQLLWVLFVARIMAGFTAATVSVAQAYVADVTTKEKRLRYIGLMGASGALALIFGPAVGGILSGFYGYAAPSFLASAVALTNFTSAYFRLPEPMHSNRDPKKTSFTFAALQDVLKRRELQFLFSLYFLIMIGFVFLNVTFAPWLQAIFNYGPLETGLLYFYIGILNALTQAVLLPRLSKKIPQGVILLLGLILISIGYAGLGTLPPSLPLLGLMGGLIAFGFGTLFAIVNSLISLNAPEEAQGGSLGIASSLAGLAQTIAPSLATVSFAYGTSIGLSGFAFIISTIISGSALPLIIIFNRRNYPGSSIIK